MLDFEGFLYAFKIHIVLYEKMLHRTHHNTLIHTQTGAVCKLYKYT